MDKKQIKVKDASVLHVLLCHRYDGTLAEIICYIAKKYGLTMTEGYRQPRHPGDVHSTDPVRAIDLRHWVYGTGVAAQIEREVNAMWQYDPARPGMKCALIHKVEGGAVHFHIQVHPNTRRA